MRFETPPGEQMQIDFGEKRFSVARQFVKVLLFVAVRSYSRRVKERAATAALDGTARTSTQASRGGGLSRRR